ncbi:MAG: tellurite resistance TerB family protein [Rubrivivax sp.]
MNPKSVFDQLLQSGRSALEEAGRGVGRDDLGKYATGAAVGGVLGLLLGTRRGRRLGGAALRYGSVAALGALAWKAYQDHQARQQAAASQGAPSAYAAAGGAAATFEALPAPQQELHGRLMLEALVAAAMCDGHIDERERALVQDELERTGADAATRQWFADALRRPVDARALAAAATTPEQAVEVYLASLLVVGERSPEERAYLEQLAAELRLAPGLKAELESRALAAR